MFSFEFNKLAGAFLGACVLAMGLGIAAEGIYSSGKPAKPGYDLPEAKAEVAAEKPVAAVPLPVLLAKADVTKGQAGTKVCQACHNFEKGAGAKVGPALYGVVDRPKGSMAGFDYSAGLKAKGGNWTYDDINQFLISPKAYISGTKMAYGGEAEASKRADIIAYLRTLSDTPAPLPAVTEAPAADAKPAEAKATSDKPADTKPSDAKPSPAKPADAKPAEAPAPPKPAEASKPAETPATPAAPAKPSALGKQGAAETPAVAPKAEAPVQAAAATPAAPSSTDTSPPQPYVSVDPQYPADQK